MNTIIVYHSAKRNFPLFKFQKKLNIEVVSLESIKELKEYSLDKKFLFFCETKLFLEQSNEVQQEIKEYSKHLVLTAEFSESYMFEKAQSLPCADFLVTPFGLEEVQVILKRLNYY